MPLLCTNILRPPSGSYLCNLAGSFLVTPKRRPSGYFELDKSQLNLGAHNL